MDCFLIKDCIWNDETEIETVSEIVAESIRNFGYNLTIDIDSIKDKIEKLWDEVKTECQPIREYKAMEKKVYHKDYYKLEGLNTYPQYCFIAKADFNKITTDRQSFYFWEASIKNNRNFSVQKSGDIIRVADSGWSDCYVEEEEVTKKKKETRRPSEKLIGVWNGDVTNLINEALEQAATIEKHRAEKLDHLQTNVFVDKGLATIVEENLLNTLHQLQDLKLEAEKIKSYYDGLE